MRQSEVRRFVLDLPEVVEGQHGGRPAFRIRKRLIAVFQPGGKELLLHVSAEEGRALTTGDPDAFVAITNKRGAPVEEWITVRLGSVDPALLRELLEDAWRRYAPKRAITAYDGRSDRADR